GCRRRTPSTYSVTKQIDREFAPGATHEVHRTHMVIIPANGRTIVSRGRHVEVHAISATSRRTSLGRKRFSITGRPLSTTNSRKVEARVSPVTKTTRPACSGQRR